jgi:hypothetical protein
LEHFIRLAKKNERVRQWIVAHKERMEWMIKWITQYPLPPKPGEAVVLHKPLVKHSTLNPVLSAPSAPPMIGPPNAVGPYSSIASSPSRVVYVSAEGLSAAQKRECLLLLRDGKPISSDDASDSDEDLSERVFTVGTFVDCMDTVKKWLAAVVVETADNGRRVKIHYDGFHARWDEWLSSDSERITKFGRFSAAAKKDKTTRTDNRYQTSAGGARIA